jgi:NADPH2:quinone reductase
MSVEDQVARFTGGQGFDIVFDAVGGAILDRSFVAVRRFGHVVSALGWGAHALAPLSFKAASYSGIFTLLPLLTGEGRSHHGDILTEVAGLVEAGKLTPRLDPRTFHLSDTGAAHSAVQSGSASGKIVIDVSA